MSKTSVNVKRLYDDLPEIARRLTAGEPLTPIMRQYRVGYETLRRAALTVMTDEQLRAAAVLARKLHVSSTCFAKGHPSWCKGKKGLVIPGCEKGWFEKGSIRGQAARRYRAVGTILVRADHPTRRQRRGGRRPKTPQRTNRRYIKVRDDGPPARRFMPYARWLWEKANGPVPRGLVIVHLDGDSMNDDPSNHAPATRAQSLALLRKLRPDVEKLRRRKSAAAMRRRKGRPSPEALSRSGAAEIASWYCCGCGATYAADVAPDRCPKCSGGAFEPVMTRRLCG